MMGFVQNFLIFLAMLGALVMGLWHWARDNLRKDIEQEKKENAIKEAQRHADGPRTPAGFHNRLRERIRAKRKAKRKS
jgi:hypothetical protein